MSAILGEGELSIPPADPSSARDRFGCKSSGRRRSPKALDKGIETQIIESVLVHIYSPANTIVDLFRHAQRQKVWYGSATGLTQALQGMKAALRLRKATPAEIAHYAIEAGIWEKVVQPRLEALTVDA